MGREAGRRTFGQALCKDTILVSLIGPRARYHALELVLIYW